MQITISRRKRFSTLDHHEISEAEVGDEGEAGMDHASIGDGMANANPTRLNKEQLHKEPLCVTMHKAPSASACYLFHRSAIPATTATPLCEP